MTHFSKDSKLRCNAEERKPGTHVLGLLLGCVFLIGAAHAEAQIRLENSIKKVETFVNAQGDVERRLVDADSVVPGDEIKYTVRFTNEGADSVDAGTIVITDAIPAHTSYVDGTAFGAGTSVQFSVDGNKFADASALVVDKEGAEVTASAEDYAAIRWTFAPELEPGQMGYVSFNVRLK